MDLTTAIALLALVVSVISVCIARDSKRLSYDVQENQIIEQLESKLETPLNRGIADLISQKKPVLVTNAGPIAVRDLEAYLNILEDVQIKVAKKNISISILVENGFDEYVQAVKENLEVHAYIQNIRQGNPGYYAGIDMLADEFAKAK